MADEGSTEREDLIHQLRNAQAEREALKHLLGKAVDRIEDLVESNCEDVDKEKAIKEAKRLRRVTS